MLPAGSWYCSVGVLPTGLNDCCVRVLECILLGSMLSNCESWINISKLDLDSLEKPDTAVQRSI